MVMYDLIDMFRALLGLGLFTMFLWYFEENIWTSAEPILRDMGMSQLGAQVIDAQFYGVEAMPVLGILFIIMATVVWIASWR